MVLFSQFIIYSTVIEMNKLQDKLSELWPRLPPSCSRWFHGSGVYLLFLSKYTVKYYNYFLSIFKKMLYY
jgi:hypothetical protein